ncbi:MAG TPA: hypothetical protein DIW17_10670 [Clostridiales bacterium]|nr:hypothetical protein [Clostridiales bacterium]
MNVEIIPATIADADALVGIQQQAFKRLYEIYHDEGSPFLRGADEIIGWLERPNWRVYKITADGVLCGGVSFCERNGMPGVYYLARIYILPEMQSKGIASTAVLLCEKTVANANLWTLDFPVEQIANRRCYEKAGYTDTGERWEQSNGAITLAYMEKKIPAFRSIKNQADNSDIIKIISYSVYECSPERAAIKAKAYKNDETQDIYAWVENGDILGVCGIIVHRNKIEITNISVSENNRHRGIGSSMITALQEKYEMVIEAETDDDAVDFYRKCGFETNDFQKQGFRRWNCILSAPKQETDEERQARIYPIILSEYNPAWPEWFAEEKANLERLIGKDNIARISHFGSTSVPGLLAKPTVDILLEIKENTDIEKLIASLTDNEYICLRQQTIETLDCIMFLKGYLPDGFAEKVYHIHVVRSGDWNERLFFRNYLISHPEAAAEYAELKRSLLGDFEHNRDGYTVAKGEFIRRITKLAIEKLK